MDNNNDNIIDNLDTPENITKEGFPVTPPKTTTSFIEIPVVHSLSLSNMAS